MQAFLHSTGLIALAETGDKTQLLSILLAARYRTFWPILAGVAIATLINHTLVAWLGGGVGNFLDPHWMQLGVGMLFIAVGLWALVPDGAPSIPEGGRHYDAFSASLLFFFAAEMGDKTQLATLTLAATYENALWQVVAGTTLGMILANLPALLLGDALLSRLPLATIRLFSCAAFVACGLYVLFAGL